MCALLQSCDLLFIKPGVCRPHAWFLEITFVWICMYVSAFICVRACVCVCAIEMRRQLQPKKTKVRLYESFILITEKGVLPTLHS